MQALLKKVKQGFETNKERLGEVLSVGPGHALL
jgi:hypothetical protein